MDYEEFARDNLDTYRRVLEFLGLEYHDPTWHQSRKLHTSPETSIKNFHALTNFATEIAEKHRRGEISPRMRAWLGAYARGYRLLPRAARTWLG